MQNVYILYSFSLMAALNMFFLSPNGLFRVFTLQLTINQFLNYLTIILKID